MSKLFLSLITLSALATESPVDWYRLGEAWVSEVQQLRPVNKPAHNVILFPGDGMGISAVEGQLLGGQGEAHFLAFKRLPYTALVKTYNTNQ